MKLPRLYSPLAVRRRKLWRNTRFHYLYGYAEILTEIKTTLARLDDLWVKLGFTLTFPCLQAITGQTCMVARRSLNLVFFKFPIQRRWPNI